MRNYYTLLSTSVLSMTLLSGCMYNTSKDPALPTASPVPNKTQAQPQTIPPSHTLKPSTPVTNTVKATEAANAKPAAKSALAVTQPKVAAPSVKTIKSAPALKAGKKLSPQEVEDLIRQLSVCRPS